MVSKLPTGTALPGLWAPKSCLRPLVALCYRMFLDGEPIMQYNSLRKFAFFACVATFGVVSALPAEAISLNVIGNSGVTAWMG
jgi:hypothetical protein